MGINLKDTAECSNLLANASLFAYAVPIDQVVRIQSCSGSLEDRTGMASRAFVYGLFCWLVLKFTLRIGLFDEPEV